jgi:hypothetical protein
MAKAAAINCSGPFVYEPRKLINAVFVCLFRPASGYFQRAEAAGAEPISAEVRHSAWKAEEPHVAAEELPSGVPGPPEVAVAPGAPFAATEEQVADTESAVPGHAAEAQFLNEAPAFPRGEAADLAPHWARAARLAAVAELVADTEPVSPADAVVAQAEWWAPDAPRAADWFVEPVRPGAWCPAQESEPPAAGSLGSALAVRLAPAALSPACPVRAPAREDVRVEPVVAAPRPDPDESALEAAPDAAVAVVAPDEERSALPVSQSPSFSRSAAAPRPLDWAKPEAAAPP